MTKKYLVITAFVLLILALGYGISKRFKPVPPQAQTPPQQPTTDFEMSKDRQTITDEKYGFSLSYPNEWKVEYLPAPDKPNPSYVIQDQYHISGDAGGFYLDTFGYSEVEAFFGWYKENNYPLPYANAPEKPNATISGLPAYVLVSPETRNSPTMLAAFWAYKGKVFRLEGTLATETFVKILESITFPNTTHSVKIPELPDLKSPNLRQ